MKKDDSDTKEERQEKSGPNDEKDATNSDEEVDKECSTKTTPTKSTSSKDSKEKVGGKKTPEEKTSNSKEESSPSKSKEESSAGDTSKEDVSKTSKTRVDKKSSPKLEQPRDDKEVTVAAKGKKKLSEKVSTFKRKLEDDKTTKESTDNDDDNGEEEEEVKSKPCKVKKIKRNHTSEISKLRSANAISSSLSSSLLEKEDSR